MRAVIYARISSDDGRGLGVGRQEQDCRALCEARGWDVVDVLVDNDVSAYSGKRRPGYERLLDGLRGRLWDVLVVWHPDRLHRRPVELEEFIDVVEASGVHVSTVTAGEIDLSTPDGRLLARITGSVARKESEDKSRRLKRKHLEKAEAGEWHGGGRRPFGYEPDGVTIREAEAAQIRSAVEQVLAGASLRSITRAWNEAGPTVDGARWSSMGVKRVLCSSRIAGLRSHRGEIVGPAVWPAIVDPDDAMRVRALLTADSRARPARAHLLSGWLYCGVCGVKMVSRAHNSHRPGRKPRRIPRYVCATDRGGCGGVGIAADPLDEFVGDKVQEWLTRRPVPRVTPVVDRTALEAVDARLVKLAEMWAAGEIGDAERAAAAASLRARRHALDAAVPAPVVFGGASIPAEWEAADLNGRREMVGSAVVRIDIAPTKQSVNRFDPDRATVTWQRP